MWSIIMPCRTANWYKPVLKPSNRNFLKHEEKPFRISFGQNGTFVSFCPVFSPEPA
jgi:hypothetical protein